MATRHAKRPFTGGISTKPFRETGSWCPADEVTMPPADSASLVEQRKERKRQTDRVAQREHRKRQKQYITELEARLVQATKNDGSELGRLRAENEQLRKRIENDKKTWASIARLLATMQAADSTVGGDIAKSLDEGRSEETGERRTPESMPAGVPGGRSDSCSPTSNHMVPGAQTTRPPSTPPVSHPPNNRPHDEAPTPAAVYSFAGLTDSFLPANNRQRTEPHDSHHDTPENVGNTTSTPVMGTPYLNIFENQATPPTMEHAWPVNPWPYLPTDDPLATSTLGQPPNVQIMKDNLEANDTRAGPDGPHSTAPGPADYHDSGFPAKESRPQRYSRSWVFGGQDSSRQTSTRIFEHGDHRSLRTLPPSLPSPTVAHPILDHGRLPLFSLPAYMGESRLQELIIDYRARKIIIPPPSVDDFLYDNQNNLIALELKAFLLPVLQQRRMAEYSGTYWIVYLLIRWLIHASEEHFMAMPDWMRPTDAQLAIEHSLPVDFLAWPELRSEVLMIGMLDPPRLTRGLYLVAAQVELEIDAMQVSLTQNSDLFFATIFDLKNWTLREEFFTQFPQYRHLTSIRKGALR